MDGSDGSRLSVVASAAGNRSHQERLETWERADLAIDAVVGADEDAWAARPVIASKRRVRLRDGGAAQFRHGDEVPSGDFAKAARAPKRLKFGCSISECGAVGLWTTSNQRRALAAYAAGNVTEFLVEDYLSGPELTALVERCHETCRLAYVDRRQAFEGEFLVVRQQIILAATVRALLTRVLDYCDASRVVIATQHATQPRAAILAARQLSIPSVYVPHAPFASNRLYADLPADWAGLWGNAERDAYASLGADTSRMHVVGTAMHDLVRHNAQGAGGPTVGRLPLVAPSAWEEDELTTFIEACATAIPGAFAIAPHPRNRRELVHEIAPKRATVLDGVSANHLASAHCLVQCNSGIALEGMLAGVPVINFHLFGPESNYPLIREPYVLECASADDLRRIVTRLDSHGAWMMSPPYQDWTRSWCECSGQDAEDRLRALVQGSVPVLQPVLDGWSMTQ